MEIVRPWLLFLYRMPNVEIIVACASIFCQRTIATVSGSASRVGYDYRLTGKGFRGSL
jgi:hypothetical protein